MPAQVNARLIRVEGATAATGGREDWDAPGVEPAGAGALKWSGSAPAYYRETVRRATGADGPTVIPERILYLDTVDARAAAIDTDDVLVFVDPAGVEVRARASTIARRELDGIPTELQTTRLDLDDA